MKYDFDRLVSRAGTNSAKWDVVEPMFGDKDVIPMWVADMDFPTAQPIVDALEARARHPFYGYTTTGEGLTGAIVDRYWKKFKWKIEPEWIVLTPGVIPALNVAIRALTIPGDEVVLQEPVYYPFFPAVKQSGCQIVTNTLRLDNGRYEMDYEDLEKCFGPRQGMREAPSRAWILVICNPHNPIGRLWSPEEVTKAGEIAIAHGATVISDEIHCELLYDGYRHVPFGAISEEFARHSIVCFAPSKTFNLAGLSASSIIIPDKAMRDKFSVTRIGMMPGPNLFALARTAAGIPAREPGVRNEILRGAATEGKGHRAAGHLPAVARLPRPRPRRRGAADVHAGGGEDRVGRRLRLRSRGFRFPAHEHCLPALAAAGGPGASGKGRQPGLVCAD
jgi:cystathionine beta-lyase